MLRILFAAAIPAVAAAAYFEPAGRGAFLARGARYQALADVRGFTVSGPVASYTVRFNGEARSCSGADPRPSRGYYIGSAGRWGVAHYGRVVCRGLYPGVDAIYYFTREGLIEFDLDARPGADLSRVVLRVTGDTKAFRFERPVAFQDGKTVSAAFEPAGKGEYRLRLGAYDRTRPLLIDPVIGYSTYLGGSGGASGEAIAVDKDGNIYVAGTVTSNYFPTVEAMQPLFAGSNDIFVSKFAPDGKSLIYSTYIGSYGDDRAIAIAVDGAGQAFITGYSTSTEFPVKNSLQERFAGGSMAAGGDVIVLALDASGANLLFSTYIGGTLDDFGRAIALDKDGTIVIAGSTNSQDFPLVNPLQDLYGGGTRDGFLLRLSPMGEAVLFSTYIGGAGVDELLSVALSSDGAMCAGGITTSQGMAVVNALQGTYGGGARDVLLAKAEPDGSAWRYVTYLGGTAEDYGRSIAIDGSDNVYVTGWTGSGNFPRANAYDNSYNSNRDVFLSKLTPDGSALAYSTFLGHNSTDEGWVVAVNGADEPIVAGHTASLQFPAVEPFQGSIGSPGCRTQPCTADVFVARFSADGRRLLFSSYLGGNGAEQPRALRLDAEGNAWVAGYTASVNFPMAGALFPTHNGGGANIAFIAKIAF